MARANYFIISVLLAWASVGGQSAKGFYDQMKNLSEKRSWPALEKVSLQAMKKYPRQFGFQSYYNYSLREQKKNKQALRHARATHKKWASEDSKKVLVYALNSHIAELFAKDQKAKLLTLAKEAYLLKKTEGSTLWYGIALAEKKKYEQAFIILKQGRKKYPLQKYFTLNLFAYYQAYARILIQKNDKRKLENLLVDLKKEITGDFEKDRALYFAIASIYDYNEDFQASSKYFRGQLSENSNEHELMNLLGSQLNKLHHKMIRENKKGHQKYFKEANVFLRKAMKIYEEKHLRKRISGLTFPLKGRVLVASPWDSGGTHSGYLKYCYDFYHLDKKGSAIKRKSAKKNSDFIAFGKGVYAARAGIVEYAEGSYPDRKLDAIGFTRGNAITLKHKDGSKTIYVHLKQNSLKVGRGQRVRRGQKIAQLGNSGMSYRPHLHFCAYDKNDISLPHEFRKLKVKTPNKTKEKTIYTTKPLKAMWIVEN